MIVERNARFIFQDLLDSPLIMDHHFASVFYVSIENEDFFQISIHQNSTSRKRAFILILFRMKRRSFWLVLGDILQCLSMSDNGGNCFRRKKHQLAGMESGCNVLRGNSANSQLHDLAHDSLLFPRTFASPFVLLSSLQPFVIVGLIVEAISHHYR